MEKKLQKNKENVWNIQFIHDMEHVQEYQYNRKGYPWKCVLRAKK